MLFLVCVRYVGDDLVCKTLVVILRPRRKVALSSEKVSEVLLREIGIKTYSKARMQIESRVLETFNGNYVEAAVLSEGDRFCQLF